MGKGSSISILGVKAVEDELKDNEIQERKEKLGGLADLPSGHPALIENEVARERFKKKEEEKKSAPDVVKPSKKISRSERIKVEQERERIVNEKIKVANGMNEEIEKSVEVLVGLARTAANARVEFEDLPEVSLKMAKLERMLIAVHRGLVESKISRSRIRGGR